MQEAPTNPNVQRTLEEGLTIDEWDPHTPADVIAYVRDFYNLFHAGISISFVEILGKVEETDGAWKVYAERRKIPLSKGGRGEDATAKHLEKYLQDNHKDVFSTRDLFESARSLWNNLKRFRVWEQFENMVGENCDYLAAGLTHRDEVKLIHFWSVKLAKFMNCASLTGDDIKVIFLAGVKTMIPMEQKESATSVHGSWVLSKYGPEAENLIKLVLTDMVHENSKVYSLAISASKGEDVEQPPPTKKAKTEEFSQDLSKLPLTIELGKSTDKSKCKTRNVLWLDDVHVMVSGALKDAEIANKGCALPAASVEKTKDRKLPNDFSFSLSLSADFSRYVWDVRS